MAKRLDLEQAGHPTAPNGQCPICYSEGYEDAEDALESRITALTEMVLTAAGILLETNPDKFDDAVDAWLASAQSLLTESRSAIEEGKA